MQVSTSSSRRPIKLWIDTKSSGEVQVEEEAFQQLKNVASLPFIHKHIAVMPDVHWGMGATIGSVIPTIKAIIPAAVGVDIGCGMMAVQTSLNASDLPDNLLQMRLSVEAAVPHGRTNNGGVKDEGSWHKRQQPSSSLDRWNGRMDAEYNAIIKKHPKARAYNTFNHMGTIGSGNHLIEVCLYENDTVWIMLHSGSRGDGNKIGMYFIG